MLHSGARFVPGTCAGSHTYTPYLQAYASRLSYLQTHGILERGAQPGIFERGGGHGCPCERRKRKASSQSVYRKTIFCRYKGGRVHPPPPSATACLQALMPPGPHASRPFTVLLNSSLTFIRIHQTSRRTTMYDRLSRICHLSLKIFDQYTLGDCH